ncbi:hypothetical protein AAF712_015067 [Marasmius tenuissimus]|uniref:Uncharacterized protein n=1 Tax=Marasmius tenuissimus TaxID=585030 RepID=A0ABR2ZBH7_9AGAR
MSPSHLRITLGVVIPLIFIISVLIFAYLYRPRHQPHRSFKVGSNLGRNPSQSSTRNLTEKECDPNSEGVDAGVVEAGALHLLDPATPSPTPSSDAHYIPHIPKRPGIMTLDPTTPIRTSATSSLISRTYYRHDMSTGLPLTAASKSPSRSTNQTDTEGVGWPLSLPTPFALNQSFEDILPPPTPLYLASERSMRRMTPDVPVDLDEQGNSLKISRWKGLNIDT